MKRAIFALLVALSCALPLHAQWTTVTASKITDGRSAIPHLLATGKICLTAVDADGNAIGFQIGGGGQSVKTPYCAAITSGAIADGFTVPDSAVTAPVIAYKIEISDGHAVVRRDITSGGIVTGTTWNYDDYIPNIGNVASSKSVDSLTVGKLTITKGCVGPCGGGGGAAYDFSTPLSLSGATVSLQKSDSTHNGYLSYGDWATFNAKQNALAYVPEQVLTFSAPLSRATNTISIDLSSYITSSALTSVLSGYATTASLSGYVTPASLASTLSGYAQNSALANYALISSMPQSIRCSGTDKISGYNASTMQFTCDPDQTGTAGTGITSLDGATTVSQSFADGANIHVATNTTTGVHTIAFTGTLPQTKGATSGQPILSYDATTGQFAQGSLTAAQVGALPSTTVLPANTTATAHYFFTSYNSTTGAFNYVRPTCSDLSDSGSLCGSSAALPSSTAATAHYFLTAYNNTTGAFSTGRPLCADLSDAGTLCGSSAALAQTYISIPHKWLSAYNAGTGAFTQTQPACSDLSDAGTLCASSATIPSTPSGVGLGNVTNDAQTKASIVPNTFTGLRYGNNGSADSAATAAQIVSVIGSTAVQNATNATTAGNITATSNSTLTSLPNLSLPYSQISSPPSIPSASSATPLMNGSATAGTSTNYAREGHVHPTDTSRAADSAVVHNTGTENVGGAKTFTSTVSAPEFDSTDTVNNSMFDMVAGSGGDTTCPTPAAGHVLGCYRNNQLQISNNGGAYAAPGGSISLTTTGTSGAATLSSGTLNIPQYQGALTLTTTGSSGAATLTGGTLNIPQYTGSTFPGFTNAPDPTATVAAGTYSSTQTVSFQCSMGIVACGIAGQAPLASCTNISVSATSTYSAMCWELGLIPKTPATFAYTISSSAPTYGGATSMTQVASPSSPITFNHTLTSGATALIVTVAMDTAGSDVSTIAVTYNGAAMTLLGSKESGTDASGNGRVYMFAMTSPASGTHAVSISYTGTGPEHCESTAVDFLSAGMPTLAGSSNGQLVTNPSITVTGTTGHLNLAAYTSGSAAGTIMQGTQVASSGTVSSGAAGFLTSARQNGAASVTFQYPTNSDWYAYVVADIPGN